MLKNVTDKELAALLKRACGVFGDQAIERVLQVAVATAARSGAGSTDLRAAFGDELRRLLAAH